MMTIRLKGVGEYQLLTKDHDGHVMTLYAMRSRGAIGPIADHPVRSEIMSDGERTYRRNFVRGGFDDVGFNSPEADGVLYPSVEVKNESGQVEVVRSFVSNGTVTQTDDEYVLIVNGEQQTVPKGTVYPISLEGSFSFCRSKRWFWTKFTISIHSIYCV